MAEPISLSVRTKWRKKPTDCRNCELCEEPIYSNNMYILYIYTDVATKTHAGLCESCYQDLKEENKIR